MKKLSSLLLALAMALCIVSPASAAGQLPPNTYPTSISVEAQIAKEQPAINAYDQINSALGIVPASDPSFPNYPDDFGGAYYQSEKLVICLTDNSSDRQQFYLNLVDNPDVIRFKTVDYSYNNLYSLSLDIADSITSSVSSISVDIPSNEIVVGAPSNALSAIPNTISETDAPIKFVEEDQSSVSAEVLGGGKLTYGGSYGTVTICGTSKGSNAVLTAGHCVTEGTSYKYNGSTLGTGYYRCYETDHFYDYGIIKVTGSGQTMTNKVYNNVNYTTITSTKSVSSSLVGTTVCKYGAARGFGTGTVDKVNAVVSYSSGITLYGMSKVTFNSDSPNKGYKGDSGSPVYAGHVLYGIYSGDNAKTSTQTDATYYWFSPINGVGIDIFSVKTN
jgi:hypothetical protein